MSRPQSKKELEEAGRRKLEAFRKQKAAAKGKTAPQQSTTAPPLVGGPNALARELSAVLPVSTSAGLYSLDSGPLSNTSDRLSQALLASSTAQQAHSLFAASPAASLAQITAKGLGSTGSSASVRAPTAEALLPVDTRPSVSSCQPQAEDARASASAPDLMQVTASSAQPAQPFGYAEASQYSLQLHSQPDAQPSHSTPPEPPSSNPATPAQRLQPSNAPIPFASKRGATAPWPPPILTKIQQPASPFSLRPAVPPSSVSPLPGLASPAPEPARQASSAPLAHPPPASAAAANQLPPATAPASGKLTPLTAPSSSGPGLPGAGSQLTSGTGVAPQHSRAQGAAPLISLQVSPADVFAPYRSRTPPPPPKPVPRPAAHGAQGVAAAQAASPPRQPAQQGAGEFPARAPLPMQAHAAAYASLSDSYLSNGAASGLQTSSTTAAGGGEVPSEAHDGLPLAEASLEDWGRQPNMNMSSPSSTPQQPPRKALQPPARSERVSGQGAVGSPPAPAEVALPRPSASSAQPSNSDAVSALAYAQLSDSYLDKPRATVAPAPAPQHVESPAVGDDTAPPHPPRVAAPVDADSQDEAGHSRADDTAKRKAGSPGADDHLASMPLANGNTLAEHQGHLGGSAESSSALANGHEAGHRAAWPPPTKQQPSDLAAQDRGSRLSGPPPPPPWLAALSADGHPSSGPRSASRDFSALQQHIDELTQQKFELARGLEGQRKVAETLASENQALTDDFNRQGETVQQLRKDMAGLHAQVKAQQSAVVSMAAERDSCRSATAEAADSAQRLAREVVALEEKMLQAQSAQLKAARDAGSARDELKRSAAALLRTQTECESMNATLATLREEKQALNAKLRKATLSAGLNAEHPPRDVGTQTEAPPADVSPPPKTPRTPRRPTPSAAVIAHPAQDAVSAHIAASAMAAYDVTSPERHVPTATSLPEAVTRLLPVSVWSGGVAGAAAVMIADERASLDSIHALLDTIETEKRDLLSQLDAQKARCAALEADRRQLNQKLELATQRFELAVARSFTGSRGPTGDLWGGPGGHMRGSSFSRGPTGDFGFPPLPRGPHAIGDQAEVRYSALRQSSSRGTLQLDGGTAHEPELRHAPKNPAESKAQSSDQTRALTAMPRHTRSAPGSPADQQGMRHAAAEQQQRGPLGWLFSVVAPPPSPLQLKGSGPTPSALV